MSTVIAPVAWPAGRDAAAGLRARRMKSTAMGSMCVLCLVALTVPLVMVLGYVIARGASIVDTRFLTSDIPFSNRAIGPGMGPAVVGTLLITGLATLMAVPLGVLGGVYLAEYASSRSGRVVRMLADVMTGVPSIVTGLFVYTLWVLNFGVSGFAGAAALACLMLPVVVRTSEEMIRLVPGEQRHAAWALGGRRAGTIVRVVLPAAAPGILSGALLAVARAAGETAPLLFTILTVSSVNANVFSGPNTALSVQIFSNAQSVFPGSQQRAWGAALTLVAIVAIFTVAARMISALSTRRHHR